MERKIVRRVARALQVRGTINPVVVGFCLSTNSVNQYRFTYEDGLLCTLGPSGRPEARRFKSAETAARWLLGGADWFEKNHLRNLMAQKFDELGRLPSQILFGG
jgi:hypothetical protein